MNMDHDFLTVFCRDEYADRKLVGAFSRAELMTELLAGRLSHLQWVVEWNAAEGTARIVSEDFARELAGAISPGEEPRRDIRDFIEEQLGVGIALPAAA
jgi:hypothetical protein